MYNLEDIKRYMAIYSPKGFLIDTCVLILFLVGSYDASLIERSKSLSSYTAEDFDLLKKILSLFEGKDLFITTQVITELSNISNKDRGIHGQKLDEYFGSIIKFLQSVKEHYQSVDCLYNMKITILTQFGFTDMTLLEVAKKERIPIITADHPFTVYGESEGVPMINFKRIQASTSAHVSF